MCGMLTPSIIASPSNIADGPVCPADAPCLYQGFAKPEQGAVLRITVHRLNEYTTDLVAKFKSGSSEIQTAYVFPSGNGDGKWYFNWNGQKYWFEM